ncbi:MAG: sulfatase-like hydrolase/transferase [Planctomycetes bacterium]|nr:sulfatase-like hydrolase/transferase [Planctomycetota bacterium]MCP4771648.1 sulfatase-like hydrolase/transferase [Planctomycetota bacterium]MCP4860052.1 sulfatase-like hydrolase/transferase [Planctomycetota bacterium]
MIKSLFLRSIAILAGACLASIVSSLFGGSTHPFFELLWPTLFGNLLLCVALLVVTIALGLAPAVTKRRLEPASMFWMSALACLAPSFHLLGLPGGGVMPLAVALAAVGLYFGSKMPPRATLPQLGLLVLTVIAALYGAWSTNSTMRKRSRQAATIEVTANPSEMIPQSPDVILLSIDTLRADSIAGPREPAYELPWFDGKRANGTWWDYGYSSSNQTLPGHTSMLSGLDSIASGVRYNFDALPTRYPLLQEHLWSAGFQTAGVISNSLLSSEIGFGRGFDAYDDSASEHYGPRNANMAFMKDSSWLGQLLPAEAVAALLNATSFHALGRVQRDMTGIGMRNRGRATTDQALEMLDKLYAVERPYFFFLHYLDPHHPYGAPEGFDGRLTGDLPELLPRYQGPADREGVIRLEQLHTMRSDLLSSDPKIHAEAKEGAAHYHQLYLENVMYLDSLLEEVQARVNASGRPTLWLITADHGEQFGENNSLIHGNHLYQDSIRVPFIIEGPNVEHNYRTDLIPDVADVAPTLLAYLMMEPPSNMTGRPLLVPGQEPRHHICGDDGRVMIRLGDWKMIAKRGAPTPTATALYDLAADPEELNNLVGAEAHAEQQQALFDLLVEQMAFEDYQATSTLAAGQAEALAELGYADGMLVEPPPIDLEHKH